MKKALTLLVLLVSLCLQAQSHNYKNCKLARKILISEVNICPACSKKMQKEEKARQAEHKRVSDANLAKRKAEAEARNKAASEELARIRANQTSTEVVINAQPSTPVKPEQMVVPGDSHGFMTGMDVTTHFYDFDAKKAIERPSNVTGRPIYRTKGTKRIPDTETGYYLHPKNTGAVEYVNNPAKYCAGYNLSTWDIVDYNFNGVFKDEDIHYIEHFFGDWFLVGYLACDDYEREYSTRYFNSLKLYNRATKQFRNIELEGTFVRFGLIMDATRALHHKSIGDSVFHNPFYATGKLDTTNSKHGGFDFFFDDKTGGKDAWKAAVTILAYTSFPPQANDAHYVFFTMDKNGDFKTFTATTREYMDNFYKEAQ